MMLVWTPCPLADDNHVPNLSVLETLEFASRCQTSPAQAKEAVGAMDAAAQRLMQAKDKHNASYQLQEDGAAGGQLDNEVSVVKSFCT